MSHGLLWFEKRYLTFKKNEKQKKKKFYSKKCFLFYLFISVTDEVDGIRFYINQNVIDHAIVLGKWSNPPITLSI